MKKRNRREPYSTMATLDGSNGTMIHCPTAGWGRHPACNALAYGWSTGFLAMLLTHERFPNAKLHVMGMNWNGDVQTHPWRVERKIMTNLTWVAVHDTATAAYSPDGRSRCQA